MTVSSTANKVSYSGNGSLDTFAYTFKIFADSDLKVFIRTSAGTETLKTISTHYTVTNAGVATGGNVVFTSGNIPASGETVVIQRELTLTQGTDYVENDPFPAQSHEDALDRLTFVTQQMQEELDRSIKASVTNTITNSEFTVSATDRANKVFAFDASGNLSVTQELGTNRGDWAASTSYAVRDLVKDTSTGNIFFVNEAHTSSGSQPLTTNTNSSKYDLLIESLFSGVTAGTVSASKGVLVDGNKDITGFRNVTLSGDLTLGSGAVISEAELEAIDGVTAGTVTASKAVIVDSNKDIASFRNITLTGELDAGSLDVSGDADIDGTLETDALSINGTAVTATGAELNYSDTGAAVGTVVASKVVTADANKDVASFRNITLTGELDAGSLDVSGDADIDGTLEADAMTLNGTAITATATLDTGISNNNVPIFTSGVADNDFLRVDGTAIEGRSASEVLSDIAAAPAAGSSNIVTTGALNSGSITSGFGAIDNGASAITTTGVITGGTLEATADTSAGDNAAIGYTAAEGLILTGQGSTSDITLKNDADATVFSVPTGTDDILFPDGAKAMFGASSDLQISHNGSYSLIADSGTGNLILACQDFSLTNPAVGENMITAAVDGAVTLFFDNAAKVATSSGGVDITGDTAITGHASIGVDAISSARALTVAGATDGSSSSILVLYNSSLASKFAVRDDGFVSIAGNMDITTSDNSNNLTLTSTDADANTGPNLVMTRASGSPADNDAIGELTFNFNNDAAENTVGTRWRNFIIDASDGTEDAAFDIFSIKAGALTSIINYDASTLSFNDGSADIDFRVESNGNANMLTVNAGEDKVGIGRDPGTGVLDIQCGNTTALQAIRIADTSPTEYFGVFNANEGGKAPNAANATLKVRGMNTTDRAINAGGTVNASGADYAEYMTKADDCGTIAKGAVCGVDADGKLTDVFANAHSFVIKSTDPSYVGGDVWSIASTDADGNQTTLEGDALETARQKVDRIAFSGQVPCTITGATKVGDFVVAQATSDGGIEAVAVTSPTFEQYSVAIGKVWKLGSSQHTVAVKIG